MHAAATVRTACKEEPVVAEVTTVLERSVEPSVSASSVSSAGVAVGEGIPHTSPGALAACV